jgi:multidrug efflux pump subunit AcrA (membrane-fusion protein)
MRTSAEQRRQAEQRIRAAADALLRGDIPPDGKCDITTLARQAAISRAALYRTYPHLKEEFEQRLAALHAGGVTPDPRDAQIARLKAVGDELRQKLADRDAAMRDLEQFRELALSRLASQHDEITCLRRQATAAKAGNVRTLTAAPAAGTIPVGQEAP